MILILHSHSHVGVVRDLSQWSVYTCERTACNSCSKEKIPVEIVTMAKVLTASIGEDIGTPPCDLPHQVFRLRRPSKQIHSVPVPNAYASSVTTGVTSKFSVGGGEEVVHSSPLAPHGLGPATGPYRADQIK